MTQTTVYYNGVDSDGLASFTVDGMARFGGYDVVKHVDCSIPVDVHVPAPAPLLDVDAIERAEADRAAINALMGF